MNTSGYLLMNFRTKNSFDLVIIRIQKHKLNTNSALLKCPEYSSSYGKVVHTL